MVFLLGEVTEKQKIKIKELSRGKERKRMSFFPFLRSHNHFYSFDFCDLWHARNNSNLYPCGFDVFIPYIFPCAFPFFYLLFSRTSFLFLFSFLYFYILMLYDRWLAVKFLPKICTSLCFHFTSIRLNCFIWHIRLVFITEAF